MADRIMTFLKRDAVLSVAAALALASMLAVPPDGGYAAYVDWRTLGLLLSLMLATAGLRELGVFRRMGQALLRRARTARSLAAALTALCFFPSMLITNDVALITFVPLSVTVLTMAGRQRLIVPVAVLQTVAANLGSMATPLGNPQNLYLFTRSGMSAGAFFALVAPYVLASLALCALALLAIPRAAVPAPEEGAPEPPMPRLELAVYAALFLLCVAAVARLLPWQAALAAAVAAVLALRPRLLAAPDYGLLATFIAFFVFIGNLGRLPAFRALLAALLSGHELLTAAAASQVISNVPAALLLSGFTDRWDALILGTDLGGLGTLIASMASLISYKAVARALPDQRGRYLVWFTAVNGLFLAVLLPAALVLS